MDSIKMVKTTTIRISDGVKIRLESLGKFGESHNDLIEMLLYHWAHPKKMTGGIYGRSRTLYPQFSKEEEESIMQRLRSKLYEPIHITPKEIDKKLKKETQT